MDHIRMRYIPQPPSLNACQSFIFSPPIELFASTRNEERFCYKSSQTNQSATILQIKKKNYLL